MISSPSVIMLTRFGNFFFFSSLMRFFFILSRASLINFFLFSISSFVFDDGRKGSSMLLISFGRLSNSSKVFAPTSLGGWIDWGGKMSLNEVGFIEEVKILKISMQWKVEEKNCHDKN